MIAVYLSHHHTIIWIINNGYSKGHKRKKSNRKSKTNSDQIDFIPKTEINVNYSNERNKNPTIDTMKHLIERAQIFGQTQRDAFK